MLYEENGLVQSLLLDDYKFTNNPYEAIFVLPDGHMLDGEFCGGVRGADHNMLYSYISNIMGIDDGAELFDLIHDGFKIIELVPETSVFITSHTQKLTKEQRDIVRQLKYNRMTG